MKYCSVVPKEIVEYYGNDFRKNPIGTGPFKFKRWEENIKLVLRKNSKYHEKDENGAIPNGLSTVARLTNTSAMRQPSAGIDPNGDIFVSFSIPIESDLSDFDANYRDIGMVYSTDGGNTWAASQNVTQALRQEDDFACIAKSVDDYVHMIWQADDQCGNNLSNDDPNFGNHPVAKNTIYYQAIPVADIKA